MKELLRDRRPEIAGRLHHLAAAVEEQLTGALSALEHADLAAADAIVARDREINAERWGLEALVTGALGEGIRDEDLRSCIAVLHVSGELERMGDHAEGIAKVALMLGRPALTEVPADLIRLGALVVGMLHDGVGALEAADSDAATALCARDDDVDRLYDAVCGELFAEMARDAEAITPCTYLLWAAHNLERIADRVTNICERTVYMVTGRVDELNTSNY